MSKITSVFLSFVFCLSVVASFGVFAMEGVRTSSMKEKDDNRLKSLVHRMCRNCGCNGCLDCIDALLKSGVGKVDCSDPQTEKLARYLFDFTGPDQFFKSDESAENFLWAARFLYACPEARKQLGQTMSESAETYWLYSGSSLPAERFKGFVYGAGAAMGGSCCFCCLGTLVCLYSLCKDARRGNDELDDNLEPGACRNKGSGPGHSHSN